jgi:hypothetical protein
MAISKPIASGSLPNPLSFLPNPLSFFSSMPARYRIFILVTTLAAIVLGLFASLLSYNPPVFSNLVFFASNLFIILLMAGLTYLLCIWTAMRPTRSSGEWLRFLALALISYGLGGLLIGFFLYLSLTALSSQQANTDLLIFVSLTMSLVLIFLSRVFSSMDWKRAEDLLFSIVIYSIVIGTLFIQSSQNQMDLTVVSHIVYVYTTTFSWAFAYSILLALALELFLRRLYARWHASDLKK